MNQNMTKMLIITRREAIEKNLEELKQNLTQIQKSCSHEIVVVFQNINFSYVDAKCLFCGKKIEYLDILKRQTGLINADIKKYSTNELKYSMVKEKYYKIGNENPDFTQEQIARAINEEIEKENNE